MVRFITLFLVLLPLLGGPGLAGRGVAGRPTAGGRLPQNCGGTIGPGQVWLDNPAAPLVVVAGPWTANVRLNSPGLGLQDHPAAVADGEMVCAAWEDTRLGNRDIFFARSTDFGQTWGVNVRVNDDKGTALQFTPDVAVDEDGSAYVVWEDRRNGHADIYFASSADGGDTWTANEKVSDDVQGLAQFEPVIAVDDTSGDLYAVWTDGRNGHRDIFFSQSTDGGLTWSANTRINDDQGTDGQYEPDVAADDNGRIYAVWTDERDPTPNVYFARSDDDGASWTANVRVNDVGMDVQDEPTLAVSESGTVYVAWADNRSDNSDIYASHSLDMGATWQPSAQVNDDAGLSEQDSPSLGVDDNGRLYVAWSDRRNGDRDIYAAASSDDGVTWSANSRVNDDVGAAAQNVPALTTSAGVIHVLWSDDRNATRDIYTGRAYPAIPHP